MLELSDSGGRVKNAVASESQASPSLTFNHLLDMVGLSPDRVKLVRHQDHRGVGGETPFHLWVKGRDRFDAYQVIQRRPMFSDASHIASFVVTPQDKTLFVGLYEVVGCGRAAKGACCPLRGSDVSGFHLYELRQDARLVRYTDRLIIDWGPGKRSWVQWCDRRPKAIIEITTSRPDPPFPGLQSFCESLSMIPTLYPAWEEVLAAVKGVYLLTCPESGELYVGSATGADGFLGRWRVYAVNGHGGNALLMKRKPTDYKVSILEVASTNATADQILEREALWKVKLGSRAHGLNAN